MGTGTSFGKGMSSLRVTVWLTGRGQKRGRATFLVHCLLPWVGEMKGVDLLTLFSSSSLFVRNVTKFVGVSQVFDRHSLYFPL